MAKLRIMTGGNLDVQAYVNVFDNLIADTPQAQANLAAYLAAPPPQRANLLQAATGGPIITQEPIAGGEEPINDTNCQIFSERDQKKPGVGQRSRATVPIPDLSVGNLAYLEKYAKVVHDLFPQDKTKCCKFLFAVGMMARCR